MPTDPAPAVKSSTVPAVAPAPAAVGSSKPSVFSRAFASLRSAIVGSKSPAPITAVPLMQVWADVEYFIKRHNLKSAAFDHANAIESITVSILGMPSHPARIAVERLATEHGRALIESAVTMTLGYLAYWGEAGPHVESPAIAGVIGLGAVGTVGPRISDPLDPGPDKAA